MHHDPPSTDTDNTRLTRRQLLATGGTLGTISIAGCLGVFGASKPIKEVSFKPVRMVTKLRSGNEITNINLIGPDGTAGASKQVTGGQTTVKFLLGKRQSFSFKPYPPGKYKLVAEKDGSTKQTKTVELTRSAQITNVSVVRDNHNWKDQSWADSLKFAIKNTGKLPIQLKKFQPLKGITSEENIGSGLTRLNAGNASADRKKIIISGRTAQFETTYRSLVADQSDIPKNQATKKLANKHFCNGQAIDAAFQLIGTSGFKKQYAFKITYSGNAIEVPTEFGSTGFACPNVSIHSNKTK